MSGFAGIPAAACFRLQLPFAEHLPGPCQSRRPQQEHASLAVEQQKHQHQYNITVVKKFDELPNVPVQLTELSGDIVRPFVQVPNSAFNGRQSHVQCSLLGVFQ